MESRNKLISDIYTEISRHEQAQKREEDTLKALSRMKIDTEIYEKKKTDIERNMKRRMTDIDLLRQKLIDVRKGDFDNDLNKEAEKNMIMAKKRNTEKISDRKQKAVTEKIKREKVYENNHKNNDYRIEKDYDYGYNQYMKAVETLPDYMAQNLKQMNNNKGYIWRKCWFFGDRKREYNQPIIMFEKIRGNITRIHEIDRYRHLIFEKIGKEQKRLIETIPRNKFK
jgi:hypothetical protein